MTFRTSARARMSNARLEEAYFKAVAAHREVIRSVDASSSTGTANVHTVLNNPDYAPALAEVNRLWRELHARGLR